MNVSHWEREREIVDALKWKRWNVFQDVNRSLLIAIIDVHLAPLPPSSGTEMLIKLSGGASVTRLGDLL